MINEDLPDEYVNVLLFDPGMQHILLIRKNKPAWQKGKWNGVGGHVQRDESTINAARREVREETDIELAVQDLERMLVLTVPSGAKVTFFVAATEKILTGHTCTAEVLQRFRVDRLPHLLIPNMHWLIPMAIYNKESWPFHCHESGFREREHE